MLVAQTGHTIRASSVACSCQIAIVGNGIRLRMTKGGNHVSLFFSRSGQKKKSLLLPGPMEMDQWLKDVRASINMWPLQKTAHGVTNQMATEVFMRRERRRLQARHIWKKIEPAGSNSSGRIVRHGLQVKPLRGPRVNGSVLCTSMGLISSTLCHGNGSINMRI